MRQIWITHVHISLLRNTQKTRGMRKIAKKKGEKVKCMY